MYERRYNEVLDEHLEYGPGGASYIEIWSYEDEHGRFKSDIKEGPLQEDNIEAWLEETNNHLPPRVVLGGLRLILCHRKREDSRRWLRNMPFPPTVIARIIESFDLPRPYLTSLLSKSAQVGRFSMGTAAGKTNRIGFLFRTPNYLSIEYGLATSHDVETGVTCGLIHGLVEDSTLGSLINLLHECSEFALHPMLIPIVASEMFLGQLQGVHSTLHGGLLDMELATGQHNYVGTYTNVDPLKIDFLSLTRGLNGKSLALGQLEVRVEYQQHQIQRIVVYNDELLNLPLDARRKEKILQMSESLQEHVEYIASQLKDVVAQTRIAQRRVSTMLSVVYNFIAQRDNKLNIEVARDSKRIAMESKRDSSSMKTIAVLTIVFLPGTFVAALFSMPMFNWQADSGTTVVSPRFWIYGAITLPLTIVVVLVWFIWIQRKDARHRREDLATRQFDDSDTHDSDTHDSDTHDSDTHDSDIHDSDIHGSDIHGSSGPPAVDPGGESIRSGTSSLAFPQKLRSLIRQSRAALGLRVAREKQNLA